MMTFGMAWTPAESVCHGPLGGSAYVNLMPVKTLNRKKIQQARLETLGGTVAVVLLDLVRITLNA